MKKTLVALALLAATSSYANCVGGGSFQHCTDAAGNAYSVSRFGNSTTVQGSNAQTGTTWNQTSQTFGGTTYQNGTASNGQSWNSTTRSFGGTTTHQGIDSNGRIFHKTCNQVGCF